MKKIHKKETFLFLFSPFFSRRFIKWVKVRIQSPEVEPLLALQLSCRVGAREASEPTLIMFRYNHPKTQESIIHDQSGINFRLFVE